MIDFDTQSCDPLAGARNLLLNCAEAKAGERLLILYEPPEAGLYRAGLVEVLADAATELGLTVTTQKVGVVEKADRLPPEVQSALAAADQAVFFARLGDQLRFKSLDGAARPVVSYALSPDMLGSLFGRLDHRLMVSLKEAIDRMLWAARDIRLTCPLGSDMRGRVQSNGGITNATSVARFPLSVFSPLPSVHFDGRIALARFLVGTGSHYYQPYGAPLEGVAYAEIGGGRILGFSGNAGDVARIRSHYAYVSELLGIDGSCVHSWHAGIHPGCRYNEPAEASYERWSAGAFGNPRILHFHTCGDYAPGEICWNVIDPTVTVDGLVLWENGLLHCDRVEGAAEIFSRYPEAVHAFESPTRDIGL